MASPAVAERRGMSAIGKAEANGFTLIEMLVVLAILGLITGIAFPAMERTVAQQRFRMAAGAVEMALHDARAKAIAKSIETPFVLPSVPEGIKVTATRDGIRFYRDGSANGGSIAISMGPHKSRFTVDPVTGLIGPVG